MKVTFVPASQRSVLVLLNVMQPTFFLDVTIDDNTERQLTFTLTVYKQIFLIFYFYHDNKKNKTNKKSKKMKESFCVIYT